MTISASTNDTNANSKQEITTMNSNTPLSNGLVNGTNGTASHAGKSTSLRGALTDPIEQIIRPRMDWWPRLRDRWGNRLAWGYAYSLPTLAEAEIDKTALASALLRIEQDLPLLAADLRDSHDRKLMEARKAQERVIAFEHEDLARQRAEALSLNEALESERGQWDAQRDAAIESHVANLRQIEDQILPAAHEDAAQKVSAAGGFYAPSEPTPACVLRHERRPLETIASELELPWAPGDLKETRGSVMGWFSLVGVGTLLGISLGLAVHMLTPYTLIDKWPVTLGCAVAGLALTYAMKQAIRGAWRHVGQSYYSRQSKRKWAVSLGSAVLRTAVLLAAEICMERQGLLAVMKLNASAAGLSSGMSTLSVMDQLVSWVIPMVISTALLMWAADLGYLEGRHHEVLCRLSERQDEIWRDEDAARRSDPTVCAALISISHVQDLLRRHTELRGRIGEIAAPFEARVAEVLARKVGVPSELSQDAKHRIQDGNDNFLGAQSDFNDLWEVARREIEPTGFRWTRLWHGVFRSRKRKGREKLLK